MYNYLSKFLFKVGILYITTNNISSHEHEGTCMYIQHVCYNTYIIHLSLLQCQIFFGLLDETLISESKKILQDTMTVAVLYNKSDSVNLVRNIPTQSVASPRTPHYSMMPIVTFILSPWVTCLPSLMNKYTTV